MIKTMSKKNFYETPCFKEAEFELKAVLCTSEPEGTIIELEDKYDWDWDDMSESN